MTKQLKAPFPYFGGKRDLVDEVWRRLGSPKQYIEPFCGSAAMLFGAKEPASLEVIGDVNGFVANLWRCTKYQPDTVAEWADYPVSHIDQCARHRWLMEQRTRLAGALMDPDWPGDAKMAGWWLWGQCSWIGSGWCEWSGKIPHVSDAGRGIQAAGQIPHVSNAGRGELLTSSGAVAISWLRRLSTRLERVRVIHGDWDRCLNAHYGGANTAVFFDPPYKAYEKLYSTDSKSVAAAVEDWCRENSGGYRIALCGHTGDYDLPGWVQVPWSRKRLTYAGNKTTHSEVVWFSPTCHRPESVRQTSLFGEAS
jgi:DNA adenine methylase